MSNKVLTYAGLSYYDRKIKDYINSYSGGGATMYHHSVFINNGSEYGNIIIDLFAPIQTAITFSQLCYSICNVPFNIRGGVKVNSVDRAVIGLASQDSTFITLYYLTSNGTIDTIQLYDYMITLNDYVEPLYTYWHEDTGG